MPPPPDEARPTAPGPRIRHVARGADSNPANRFERLQVVPEPPDSEGADPDELEPQQVPTLLLRDPSRSILARNQSPDIGFDTSLNPYRGCEHGCSYCLHPDTPVLHADLAWRPIGETRVGDELVGFDEFPEPGRTRKIRRARVEAVWASRKPTLRMITRHADVVTTAEHRWLQHRNARWSRTEQLSPGSLLRHLPITEPVPDDEDYRIGYVAGMTLGDGTYRYQPGWRSDKLGFPAAYWRVALIDLEPLHRLRRYLRDFGIRVEIRDFSSGSTTRAPMQKVETRSLGSLAILHDLLEKEPNSRSYRLGFMAGFFDAEGHNGTSLRISQKDISVLERVRRYARSIGFEMKLEQRESSTSSLRLVGPIAERIRFLGTCGPSITRKRDRVFGHQLTLDAEPIEAVESAGVGDVVDIQTSTGTFYAAGLATHNCYARPTHEYLGFSAGLDFETRVLVKPDAPALLRKALASPRWKPQVVAMSGVTDPYQPAERRLRITRGCLEVFAEFRNPVAIVTKSSLVARDADLLAELAGFGAAAANVSITSLDDDLRRRLEPRASSPKARLRAIETLAAAGVPVGVMVAPVIPGLNDAEIPAIVAAAARAGARSAAFIVLRLPHGVADLFDDWLARHVPERRAKVMNRVRSLRGGRTNDPRFGSRMRGSGAFAAQIHDLFTLACRRAGVATKGPELSTAAFRRSDDRQLPLL